MRYVPKAYRDALAPGGTNPFGEPNYILHWGPDAVRRMAVPDTLVAPYLSTWVLAEWHPREDFGPESEWPAELLPYPERGAYVPLQVFNCCRLDSEGLNPNVLRMMLWVALKAKGVKLAEQAKAINDSRLAAKAAQTKRIADVLADAFPAFNGADATNGSPSNAVRKKAEEMERRMRLPNPFLGVPKGFSQVGPPRPVVL